MGLKNKFLSIILGVSMLATCIPAYSVNAESVRQVNDEIKTITQKVDRRFVAYFTDWAYKNEQNQYYTADMMPWDKITHINYAFAHVDPSTNKIGISNMDAAVKEVFPGQTNEFPYKGHFNVINSYKKKYTNVKSLISVGGWAESSGFFTMMATQQGRETFADSCVDFIREYGFDGVDIDFEYPTNLEDAGNPNDFELAKPYREDIYENYCRMLETLRKKIDEASIEDGKDYLLTTAVTASAWVVSGMGEENFTKYLDFINLMTYDFHGSWNGFVAHNSPLYSDPEDAEIQYWKLPYNYLSTDWAVKYYLGFMDPEDIVIGIPYYTRGWKDVKPGTRPGGLYGEAWGPGKIPECEGTGATGIDNIWHDKLPDGSEEPGGSNPLWHVKNLLADESLGYERYWDDVSKVPYVWNEEKKVFLSFEDEQSMAEKIDYIVENNLGGAMVWEIDGDFDYDKTKNEYVVGDTLTTIAYDKFKAAGPIVIEEKENTLPVMDYDIEIVNGYDHPYNAYKVNLINNTGKAIPKPCKIEFDIPNSVYMKDAPWSDGAEVKVEDRGMYKHFTITIDEWGTSLGAGKSTLCEGEMILRAMGGPRNMLLNGKASKAELERQESSKVSLLGAAVSSTTTDSRDGNYSITVSVPENSNAKEFKLYEGNNVIKTQSVTSKGQKYTYNMKNKPNGTYKYKVVMSDGKNQVQSSILSVYVGPEIVLKAPIVSSSVDKSNNGQYTIKVSVPSYSNGDIMDVYEGTRKIASEKITASAKEFTYEIKDKKNGVYNYKAVIRGNNKSIESNIKSVNVSISYNTTPYDETKSYNQGAYVEYKGKIYVAIGWWIPAGAIPGVDNDKWQYVGDVMTDIVDLSTVASKYNLKSNDIGFDVSCDFNSDSIIDIYDLVILAKQM